MMVVASAARRARYWRDGHAADVGIGRKEGLQRDRASRSCAARIRLPVSLEDPLMDRLEEMLGFKEVRDAIERVVVDQDGAEQALFRLDIVRRRAIGRRSGVRRQLQNVRIRGHAGRA